MNKLFNDEMKFKQPSKFLNMDPETVRHDYMESVEFKGKDGTSLIHNSKFDMDRFIDLILDTKKYLERAVEYIPNSMSGLLRCDGIKFYCMAKKAAKYDMSCQEALETYFRLINKFELHNKIYEPWFDFKSWLKENRFKVESSIKLKVVDKEFKLIIIFE